MRHLCGVWVAGVAALAACGFNPAGDGGDDDGAADAAAEDGDDGDGATIDGAVIDAAVIDARVIDARVIDARIIDAPPIDAAVDARPMCPTSYDVPSGGSNYRFAPIALVWASAAADCNDDLPGRTHLATFGTAAEIDTAIAAVDPGNSAEPLIGATCSANDCSNMNAWSWVDGSGAVALNMWDSGQPDNGATEKAGAAIRANGNWKVMNVTMSLTTRPYICECDP